MIVNLLGNNKGTPSHRKRQRKHTIDRGSPQPASKRDGGTWEPRSSYRREI